MPSLKLRNLLIGFTILLGVGLLSFLRVFDPLELVTLDLRFRFRPPQKINQDIAIIEIADDSVAKIGRWPFERYWHAGIVDALTHFGARAILFDVVFSEPSTYDGQLVKAVADSGKVYLPCVFLPEKAGPLRLREASGKVLKAWGYAADLLPEFRKAAKRTGHINVVPDVDGKNRRVPAFIEYGKELYPQLALLLACDYLGVDLKEAQFVPGKFIKFPQGLAVPLDENSNILVNYAGLWCATYSHYSYVDVLQSYGQVMKGLPAAIDVQKLKGKICFVGLTATASHDLNPTPLEVRYPGIGIHASLLNMIAERNFLVRASRPANLLALFILALCVVFPVLKAGPIRGFEMTAVVILLYFLLCFGLFAVYGIWLDLFYPALVAVASYVSLSGYKFLVERKKRLMLENELKIAKRIQESFLPEALPDVPGLEVAAAMIPAHGVAGDLYDFVGRPDSLGIMIGDVSGKGIPAALFMAKTVSEFRFFAKAATEPSLVLRNLNEQIATSKSGLFVTMFYADLNRRLMRLSIANGGHLPALLMRESEAEPMKLTTSEGLPLGLMGGVAFDQFSLTLERGDAIILYTDGVTEAKDAGGEEFTAERLAGVMKKSKGLGAKEIIEAVKAELMRFVRRAPQHDDITIIALKVT